MEVVLVLGGLVLLAVCLGSGSAYRHWRGPTCGTMDEVQREHLELFFPEPESHEEDQL